VRDRQLAETRYFHSMGGSRIFVPLEELTITASHGPADDVARVPDAAGPSGWARTKTITLKRLPAAANVPELWSGDLHVHMNYAGHYRNTATRAGEQRA